MLEGNMKRLLSSLGLSALLLGLAPAMALAGDCYVDPVYQHSGTGRVKSGVFLRNQACVDGSSVLVTLSAGSSVNVIGFTDGWYRVESNGARGWVGQQFIETSAPRTEVAWSSYEDYMAEYPSRGPTAAAPVRVEVRTPVREPVFEGEISARNLIKLACESDADANDPCKAVYYIGADGKRHAYPNSRVFFTWYLNFDAVQTISPQALAAYPLGRNVTYRPGSRMVKFASLSKVYALSRQGSLRWIKTEEVARELYGADWNTKVDDVSDVFFNDYSFGPDIDTAASYSVSQELQSQTTFD